MEYSTFVLVEDQEGRIRDGSVEYLEQMPLPVKLTLLRRTCFM